jgi:ABC-type nitrate/sulfonate/bicarbonate transport system permease component
LPSWRFGSLFAPIAGLVGIVAAWELIVRVFSVSPLILPAPSRIAVELYILSDRMALHAAVTVTEAICGLLIGALSAVTMAVLMTILPTLLSDSRPRSSKGSAGKKCDELAPLH